jgi:tetratricopeptide (TPR) repeat protein
LVAKSVELAAEGSYADAARAIDKALYAPQDGKLSDYALLLRKAGYLQKSGDTEQAMSIAMRVIRDTEEGQQEFDEGWARIVSICSEEEEYDKLASILEGSGIDSVKSRYYNYLVYDPVFRDLPGNYESRLVLVIESQGVGSVFYTLDGSDPTEKSNLYTDGIRLRPGIYTVKALFINRYGLKSSIITGTYQVLDD